MLNASADSLGINQRAHYSIDQFASSIAVPYSTIRPAIFQLSLLAAAPEVRASRTWTGLAASGRVALIDHRDAAEAGLRVLTDPALWGAHHDLTGPVPMSWPEALELLSAELGESVTFQVAAEPQFLRRLIAAGIPAGEAELLITREWAILAGENDYTTDSFQQITGRSPRPLAEFLHEHRGNSSDARASASAMRHALTPQNPICLGATSHSSDACRPPPVEPPYLLCAHRTAPERAIRAAQ